MKLGAPVNSKNVRALVTGAGSGIGAAYARQLANLGYHLVLVGRSRAKLEATAARIAREASVEVELLPADLAVPEGLEKVVERASSDRAIEIVVNSAGVACWGPVLELDGAALQREIDLNVQATFRITTAAARAMRSRGRGAVVNVASLSAIVGFPYLATYTGTKAFLLTFSESLHEELRGTGVVVQTLLPGFTRTEMFATSGADISQIPGFLWMEADAVVRASLAALRKERAICVPGLRNKLAMLQMRLTPRWIMRKLMKFQFGRFEKIRLKNAAATEPQANAARPSNSEPSASGVANSFADEPTKLSPKTGEAPPSGDASYPDHATPLEAVP